MRTVAGANDAPLAWPSAALQVVLGTILEQLRQLVEYDVSLIWLLDGKELRLAASQGVSNPAELGTYELSLNDYPRVQKMMANGKPVIWRDVARTTTWAGMRSIGNMHGCVFAPLVYQDHPIGLLVVLKEERGYYSRRDGQSTMAFAGQVAMTIENARLLQETRDQFVAMRALYDISVDITSRLEIGQLLTAIVQHASRLLNAQTGILTAYDPQDGRFNPIVCHNLPPEQHIVEPRLGVGAAGQVVATGRPLIINDYWHWPGRNPELRYDPAHPPFDAMVVVPMFWQGQVIGTLSVHDSGERRPFTQKDARFLLLLANLASAALNNARLYSGLGALTQELERKVEERAGELAVARAQLQQLLATTVRLQEEERARIARDLHDGSNQLISAALFEIQAATECIAGQRAEMAIARQEAAKELLHQMEAENRRIIAGLRPLSLDTQGLVAALRGQASSYWERYSIRCQVHLSGRPIRMPQDIETAIYRIVQEALNNVATHAQAWNVQIRIHFKPTTLRVVVEDDGVGFDVRAVRATPGGHLGLIGMHERAQSIGGRLDIHSQIGHGTRIVIDMPMQDQPRLRRRAKGTLSPTVHDNLHSGCS